MYNAPTMHNTHELQDDTVVDEVEDTRHTEDPELADEEVLTHDKLKELRKKLRSCEAEKMASLEDLQRARADFLNSKRRLEEQLARDRDRILERVLTDFLPLLDSFDTALNTGDTSEQSDSWKKGVEVMHAQFISLLKSYNISEIEALGKSFNPHEHEAVSSVPADETQTDTVISVLQKGFRRDETILRPAKVIVGA